MIQYDISHTCEISLYWILQMFLFYFQELKAIQASMSSDRYTLVVYG